MTEFEKKMNAFIKELETYDEWVSVRPSGEYGAIFNISMVDHGDPGLPIHVISGDGNNGGWVNFPIDIHNECVTYIPAKLMSNKEIFLHGVSGKLPEGRFDHINELYQKAEDELNEGRSNIRNCR